MTCSKHLVWTLAVPLLLAPAACTDDGGGDDDMSDSADDDAGTDDNGTDTTGTDDNGTDTTGTDDNGTDTTGTDDNGTDTGTDDTGTDDTGTDTTTTGDGSEFASVYEILVAEGCTAGYCHGAGQGGLVMTDAETSYNSLVGVDATVAVCGLQKRVVAGAPEESIMWMKARPIALDEGVPCADKMPQGSEGLSDADGQVVYDWIVNGALY